MTGNLRLVSTRHSRCGDGVRESRRECSGGGGGAPLQNALCCWSSLGPVSVQFGPVLAIGRSWLVRRGQFWRLVGPGWSAMAMVGSVVGPPPEGGSIF
jgi:hypothetical protein